MQDQISQIIRINMCLSCIRTSVLQNTESGRLNQVCIIFFRNCFRMFLLLWWFILGSYLFISIRVFFVKFCLFIFFCGHLNVGAHTFALFGFCVASAFQTNHTFLHFYPIDQSQVKLSFLNIVPSWAALGLHQNINIFLVDWRQVQFPQVIWL